MTWEMVIVMCTCAKSHGTAHLRLQTLFYIEVYLIYLNLKKKEALIRGSEEETVCDKEKALTH